ncbi:hypothetical protein OG979_12090 [Actinomadura citrea]|uniref:hypothetical protein n=1 Tax=Actinomadura citrea TaxID=46158 RepID=UPI002E28EA0A|nr:hypothetical protein [Actinomadura citrea]
MSKRGAQKITSERLNVLGFPFAPSKDIPSSEELDEKLERVTHLLVVREFETGQRPSVHLVTESGVLDLDELSEMKSLHGQGMGLGSEGRHRRPLNELSWCARWRILHRDFRRSDRGVVPEELELLRQSSGTRGLSLNELDALRKIIDRFRGRGDNVEELLLKDFGWQGKGEFQAYFSPCWLRTRTRRPVTIGERKLAMTLMVLRILLKLRQPVGLMKCQVENRLCREVVVASMSGTVAAPEVDE